MRETKLPHVGLRSFTEILEDLATGEFGDEYKVHTFSARLSLKLDKGRPSFRYEIIDLPGRVADAMRAIREQVGAVVTNVYMRG